MHTPTAASSLLLILAYGAALAAPPQFQVKFDKGGIVSLKAAGDKFDTEYIAPGRTLGHVNLRYRMGENEWKQFSTTEPAHKYQALGGGGGGRARGATDAAVQEHAFIYNSSGWNDYYADVELTERFRVEGDSLYWSIHLRNPTHKAVEIGDLSFPLPFHTEKRYNKTITYEQRLVEHRSIAGNNSFVYWLRPNGIGPYLVMFPVAECPLFAPANEERDFTPGKLEFFDQAGVYIHSAQAAERAKARGGNWRQPQTSHILSPRFSRNGRLTYAFKFRWAADHQGIKDILYEEGLLDINVAPGMTIPRGLDALVAIRTKSKIHAVEPEFAKETRIETAASKVKDTQVYRVKFTKLGENRLTVKFGKDQYTTLEFFVTEPVATLIQKRAAFLVNKQQHRDPAKWYNGLYSEWDMRTKVLRSPEDTGGLLDYIVASDDPGLCKAPYIAAKNAEYPVQAEIDSVEYYLKNYVWGKLQQTDREPYPYAVYGIDNWKVNRESKPQDRNGWFGHVWRPFDYPHVINLYWSMYRVAKYYPDKVKYLDKNGYLERAFGTAKGYYTYPLQFAQWSPYEVGHYDERIIPELIAELEAVGWKDKAAWLRERWEHKVEHFINDRPNLFLSEYPFDPTGFESHHAFARYALEEAAKPQRSLEVTEAAARDFLREEISGNLVTRGTIENHYWQLGAEGSMRYMSQMGGWAILDHALYQAADPWFHLRLGYAAYLSSWALMNTGTAESNYGFWYPGPENDGAAGSAYLSAPFGRSWIGVEQKRGAWPYSAEIDLGFGGALRSAATVLADDPVFGLIAYGGKASQNGNTIEVTPLDGVQRRFHAVLGRSRFHLLLERDGFAASEPLKVRADLSEIGFLLENRAGTAHETAVTISGLPAGSYEVLFNGRRAAIVSGGSAEQVVKLAMPAAADARVVIRKGVQG